MSLNLVFLLIGCVVLIVILTKITSSNSGSRKNKSTSAHANPNTSINLSEKENSENTTHNQLKNISEKINPENKKELTKPMVKSQIKDGEKYFTPEDTEKERQITKAVEAFNREVKVQNRNQRQNRLK